MSEKIWVRAALKPNAASRPITDRGLLYPHSMHRGRYVGWRECMPGEKPEHIIPGAAGVVMGNFGSKTSPKIAPDYDPDPDKRRTDEHGGQGPVGDLFLAGPSVGLVRTAPVRILSDSDIRRAIACGDLEECEDPALVKAEILPDPAVETAPTPSPAVTARLAQVTNQATEPKAKA